jgi:NAD(P)-dependent dehydrogenase (short-subunit alcohol dehydrogenase family)
VGNAKICVVTGGSSGIGEAVSMELSRRGHVVAIVGRSPDRLRASLERVRQEGAPGLRNAHAALKLDVSDPSQMEEMAKVCRSRYGRVDLLVASAAIGRGSASGTRLPRPTRDLSRAEWQEIVGVNLHGVFLSNLALLPMMIEQADGDIINVGSSTTPKGMRGRAFAQAYCASKFAATAFTQILAAEVADSGVRVSMVVPGPVDTQLIDATLLDAPFGGRIDLGNFAKVVLDIWALQRSVSLPDAYVLPRRVS